uniref:Uncharacterized protein n=2 Tax=Rhizophora mucronata TaxID=61149 RepID=A0A2P2MWR6_RHIMU
MLDMVFHLCLCFPRESLLVRAIDNISLKLHI